jgi:hypothetical protein
MKNMIKFISVSFLFLINSSISFNLSIKSEKEIDIVIDSMIEMNKPIKEIFKTFHSLHKKTYNLNSQEGLKRYKIFKSNMKWNKEKNDELGKQVFGITPFMDITDEEFKKSHLMDSVEMEKHIGRKGRKTFKNNFNDKLNLKNNQTPQIDWRILFNENLPKDQGSCGACWSFAANAAIEGNYKKEFGGNKNLSVQYLVDCDLDDNGCNG